MGSIVVLLWLSYSVMCGTFLDRGSNPFLLNWQADSLPLSHQRACMLSHFSCAQLLVTPRTVAHQAPLSMGFSRQEYWSGLPCPPPGNLPNPEIKPRSPALQADSLPSEPPGKKLITCIRNPRSFSWRLCFSYSSNLKS